MPDLETHSLCALSLLASAVSPPSCARVITTEARAFNMSVFLPLQSIIGGVFIGTACGIYMLVASRIAGNSTMIKSLILGPRELTKASFVGGLLGAVGGYFFGQGRK